VLHPGPHFRVCISGRISGVAFPGLHFGSHPRPHPEPPEGMPRFSCGAIRMRVRGAVSDDARKRPGRVFRTSAASPGLRLRRRVSGFVVGSPAETTFHLSPFTFHLILRIFGCVVGSSAGTTFHLSPFTFHLSLFAFRLILRIFVSDKFLSL